MSDEQLDTETLVFRQIDRVMKTASLDLNNFTEGAGPQTRVIKDTDTWSHRVLMSTMFMDSFLQPIKTEKQQKKIKEASIEAENDYTGPEDFGRMIRARELFKQNVKVLQENNMVFQESDDMVIEDNSKLEPENSEVEEEVIE